VTRTKEQWCSAVAIRIYAMADKKSDERDTHANRCEDCRPNNAEYFCREAEEIETEAVELYDLAKHFSDLPRAKEIAEDMKRQEKFRREQGSRWERPDSCSSSNWTEPWADRYDHNDPGRIR